MKCTATLVTQSNDADSVASSLKADDVEWQSLSVRTGRDGWEIRTEIKADSLSTLLATVDDLIRCQITSESLICNGR